MHSEGGPDHPDSKRNPVPDGPNHPMDGIHWGCRVVETVYLRKRCIVGVVETTEAMNRFRFRVVGTIEQRNPMRFRVVRTTARRNEMCGREGGTTRIAEGLRWKGRAYQAAALTKHPSC